MKLRTVIDILLALALVAVMGTSAVLDEIHEYVGIFVFVLIIAHVVVERKRLVALFRGKKTPKRIVEIVLLVVLALLSLAIAWSSLVLSKYAFGFLPAMLGLDAARKVHMYCTGWLFIIAFAHCGLECRIRLQKLRPNTKAALGVAMIIAVVAGTLSFVDLGMLNYMTMQVQFAFYDDTKPIVLTFVEYALVGIGDVALVAGINSMIGRSCKETQPDEANRA